MVIPPPPLIPVRSSVPLASTMAKDSPKRSSPWVEAACTKLKEPVTPLRLPSTLALLAASGVPGVALAVTRPREAGSARGVWMALAALAAMAGGAGFGELRLLAIDRGAFRGPIGRPATARGFVTAVPRRSRGEVRVRIQTADGRLGGRGDEPVADLPIGREVAASGTVARRAPWEAGYLGLATDRPGAQRRPIRLTGRRRGGLAGVDRTHPGPLRGGAGSGTPEAEAALLRGFVLGEDDRIDAATVNDFRRSGLAHLLAVSGENVCCSPPRWPMLGSLALRRPVAASGACSALIGLYVPRHRGRALDPARRRMGAAGVIATLAGRPRSRWYASCSPPSRPWR